MVDLAPQRFHAAATSARIDALGEEVLREVRGKVKNRERPVEDAHPPAAEIEGFAVRPEYLLVDRIEVGREGVPVELGAGQARGADAPRHAVLIVDFELALDGAAVDRLVADARHGLARFRRVDLRTSTSLSNDSRPSIRPWSRSVSGMPLRTIDGMPRSASAPTMRTSSDSRRRLRARSSADGSVT